MGLTESEFKSALEQYAKVLKALEDELAVLKKEKSNQKLEQQLPAEICLDVFIARDKIQGYLKAKEPSLRKCLPELSQLDKQLKDQIVAIAQRFPLAEWRNILDPPTSAWWWQGEAPDAIHPWNRLDWLWEVLTIPILTVNFALVVSISARFLAGGPDTLGAFAVVGQSVVAMLAAGAPLTRAGQKIIEQGLKTLKLPKYFWYEAKLGIAVMVLLGLLGLQAALPNIANFYVLRGNEASEKRQMTSALAEYKRAIALDPNNMEAYHRLGVIYEDLLDFDQANSAYRIAMRGGCPEAVNNLARLYILEEIDLAAIAVLLKNTLDNDSRCTQEDVEDIKHSLLKNFGWVRFRQERYTEAKNHLKEAIKLDDKQAAPYCLLAQVIEADTEDENHSDAMAAWGDCLAYVRTLLPEEDEWANIARQKIEKAHSD